MSPYLASGPKILPAEFAARYLEALRAQLPRRGTRSDDRAQGLGRAALAGGLGVRDVARSHEQAMLALASASKFAELSNGALRRAGQFLRQTLMPLEAALRATRNSNRQLQQRNETLRVHARELAKSNRRLVREVARREAGERAVREAKVRYHTLYLESQTMERKLRLLTRKILSAQEEERCRISRELHDEVVQTLVGINVNLARLSRDSALGVRTLKGKLAYTRRLVETSVKAVHRFARDLRPAALDDLGLIPALHAYCRVVATRRKMKIDLTAFRGVESLGSAKRIVFYRIVQEALTNVARHSRATRVRVAITPAPGAVQLEVADNGKSFQVSKVFLAKSNKRLGLLGMKERVEMVGGTLTIQSDPATGTIVRATIPFNPKKETK
ncbi:MAG: hypothetical protein C0518_03550 [Opitutus sp.]|nr:hypothetical protein [Opitutus sp.]